MLISAIHVELVLVCLCPLAFSLTISPQVLSSPVLEGTEVVITCTTSGVGAGTVVLLANGQSTGVAGVIQSTTSVRVFSVTVNRSHNRANFSCIDTFDSVMSGDAFLPEVQCKWRVLLYVFGAYYISSIVCFAAYYFSAQGPPPSPSACHLAQCSNMWKEETRW